MRTRGHQPFQRLEAPWLFAILCLVDGLTGFGNVEGLQKETH